MIMPGMEAELSKIKGESILWHLNATGTAAARARGPPVYGEPRVVKYHRRICMAL